VVPLRGGIRERACSEFLSGLRRSTLYSELESFPGMDFVMIGSLDRSDDIEPKLEMFTKRHLKWTKPLDVPQFASMPR
jgi:hypothetical protein